MSIVVLVEVSEVDFEEMKEEDREGEVGVVVEVVVEGSGVTGGRKTPLWPTDEMWKVA